MALAIANRYAAALGEVVTKPGSAAEPSEVLEQLDSFQRLLESSQELTNVLLSPAVAASKKRALVASLGERMGFARPVHNFLYVLIDHRRLRILDEVVEAYRGWLDQRLGIARIEVTSARPVDVKQESSLQDTFQQVTEKQVRARYEVDPALLGGVVVRHGSVLYDGSLRAQLQALERLLTEPV